MARYPGFLEWNGQRHTRDEWATIMGITRQAFERRLKTLPYDKVFLKQKEGFSPITACTYPDCFSCPLPDCYVDNPKQKEGVNLANVG